ncbi:hypothetical protein I552_10227 [Mycobacterium xenopi 3993]|nr:hypothetical protein I552_10227 [Mycobacterium xenopi 3993]
MIDNGVPFPPAHRGRWEFSARAPSSAPTSTSTTWPRQAVALAATRPARCARVRKPVPADRQHRAVGPLVGHQDGTHGLDPYRRFGLPGYPPKPTTGWTCTGGHIFAENGDDKPSQIKALSTKR